MKKMKRFKATFFRRNPQFANGGYQITKTIEAKTLASARKEANEYEKSCVYGRMYLLSLNEEAN